MININFTYQQYQNGECSFDDYYGQFVTNGLIYMISRTIGKKVLLSNDVMFNDIPLPTWDGMTRFMLESLPAIAKANGTYKRGRYAVSMAEKVCVLKVAAKRYKADAGLVALYPPQ